jgi:hypothetical protein
MGFKQARDWHPVSFLAELENREQDHEFKFAEIASVCH